MTLNQCVTIVDKRQLNFKDCCHGYNGWIVFYLVSTSGSARSAVNDNFIFWAVSCLIIYRSSVILIEKCEGHERITERRQLSWGFLATELARGSVAIYFATVPNKIYIGLCLLRIKAITFNMRIKLRKLSVQLCCKHNIPWSKLLCNFEES